MRIYVASSWRNDFQPGVVRALRLWGHEVYDFRNPSQGGPTGAPDGVTVVEPELMYKLANGILVGGGELVGWAGRS